MVSTLNFKVSHSVCIMDLLNFECLVWISGIFKMCVKFSMCIVIYGWQGHVCDGTDVQAGWRKSCTYGRAQRHRHSVGFFNVPVIHRHGTTLFIRWFRHNARSLQSYFNNIIIIDAVTRYDYVASYFPRQSLTFYTVGSITYMCISNNLNISHGNNIFSYTLFVRLYSEVDTRLTSVLILKVANLDMYLYG